MARFERIVGGLLNTGPQGGLIRRATSVLRVRRDSGIEERSGEVGPAHESHVEPPVSTGDQQRLHQEQNKPSRDQRAVNEDQREQLSGNPTTCHPFTLKVKRVKTDKGGHEHHHRSDAVKIAGQLFRGGS
jgi:hypothetical protein